MSDSSNHPRPDNSRASPTDSDRRADVAEMAKFLQVTGASGDTAAPTSIPEALAPPALGPPAAPGEVGSLGPYRIVTELGRGGMGAVYAAVDTRLNRRLALKVMLPQFAADPAARERFLREARAAAGVTHDNVVTVYEADERDGIPYIAMQFLEGYPLDEYLKKKGNPSLPQVLRIARETAAGLAAAHKLGLVHRDIKPGNLWLEAPNGRVKVLDFGLAKPLASEVELTQSGAILGTPAYMSPEQARGRKVDPRSDLFSLGAVLYRLTTGRLPFDGPNTMAVLMALGTEDPPPVRELNPAVPEPLAALIHQLLAKKPGDRPQSAGDVVQRVRSIAEGRVPAALPAEPVVDAVPASAMPVTVVPENNPFVDLDLTEIEPAPRKSAAAARMAPAIASGPGRRKPWLWIGISGAAVSLVAVAITIATRKKDGGEPKGEPPGPAVSTDKGGKPAPSKTVNLLALVDPKRDTVAGRWKMDDGKLVAGGPTPITPHNEILQISYVPPAEYDMMLVVERSQIVPHGPTNPNGDQSHAFAIMLTAPQQFHVYLDFDAFGKIHVLGLLDGKLDKNETAVEGDQFDGGRPVRVDIRVRRDEIGVRLDGKDAIRYQGNQGRLSLLAKYWAVPDPPRIGLGSQNAEYRIREWTLTPVGDGKGVDTSPDRKAAEWVLKVGGTIQVAGDDRAINAAADLPKTRFTLSQVELKGRPVADTDLAVFHRCTGLTALGLSSTKVTDAGLDHFSACTGLTYLFLDGTAVTDTGLTVFRDCKALKALSLYGTAVTDAGLACFKDCAALEFVYLEETKVTDAGLAHLRGCRGLAYLGLNHTRVTDAGLAHLKDRTALRILLLVGTGVTDAGLGHLGGCTGLHTLFLNGCGVTDAGLAALKGLTGLTTLDAANTKVTERGAAEFHAAVRGCKVAYTGGEIEAEDVDRKAAEWVLEAGGTVRVNGQDADVRAAADLPKEKFVLTTAALDALPVTDVGLANLAGARGLTTVRLHRTGVTDAGLARLEGLPALQTLLLPETRITDTGLVAVAHVRSLKNLDVRLTGVSAKGLANFHAALPGCKIEHDGGIIEPKK